MKSSQSKLIFAYPLVSTQKQGVEGVSLERQKNRGTCQAERSRDLPMVRRTEHRGHECPEVLFRGHAQSTCASCKPIRSSFHERMGILALGHDLENLLPF